MAWPLGLVGEGGDVGATAAASAEAPRGPWEDSCSRRTGTLHRCTALAGVALLVAGSRPSGRAWLVPEVAGRSAVLRPGSLVGDVSALPLHASLLNTAAAQRSAAARAARPATTTAAATAASPALPLAGLSRVQRCKAAAEAGAAAVAAAALGAVRRLTGHRLPSRRMQSPVAEIAFGLMLYASLCSAVRSWHSSVSEFALRDELFQEMAVAHTYKNSVWPWVQTGIIALVASFVMIIAVKAFIKSMKEWENRQEMKEMGQMGEDALFLMSTPVDATPLEKKKFSRKKKGNLLMRLIGGILNVSQLLRLGACVGYLLPLLNVLDFGEISVSLYPYALGVPPSELVVNFLQNKMKLKFLYKAYLGSGYYFLIVWFIFIQLTVRNKSAPFYVRFHSSQAILISMLLGVPQQVFFAVLNPWESGLVVQTIMYHSMVSLFLFVLVLVMYCCVKAMLKQTMTMPLVSEAAVMWAGKE